MVSQTTDSAVGLRRHWWERWDLHPVVRDGRLLYRQPRCLYRQRSRGVIDGTCTHFNEGHGLVPRLLRTRPPSVRPGGVAPPSLGYRPSRLTVDIRAETHVVAMVGLAPTFPRFRTEYPSCWATSRRKVPCQKAGDVSSGCHTTRRPGSWRPGRSTPPANRTLLAPDLESRPVPDGDVNGGRRSTVRAECSGEQTHRVRPAEYHREELNLSQRPSQNRVPSVERWRGEKDLSSGRPGLHQRHRGCHPRALLLSYAQSWYHREELNLSRRDS
jgi:hypothetical protein